MVTTIPIRLPLLYSWGWGGTKPSNARYYWVRHGETDNGEDVFDVERGRFGSVCVLLVLRSSLSLF